MQRVKIGGNIHVRKLPKRISHIIGYPKSKPHVIKVSGISPKVKIGVMPGAVIFKQGKGGISSYRIR